MTTSLRTTRPCARWPVAALLLPLLLLPACSGPGEPEDPKTCQVPAGSRQLDNDPEDSPETPWTKPKGKELVVYFETAGLSGRYTELVGEAAQIWSHSPCLDAVAVAECPADGNCVSMRERFSGGGRHTDGEFTGHSQGGIREGGRITLYTRLLDRSSDNGALATIVHEMGHALGLVHRQDPHDVMNSVTGDDTDAVPDSTDFHNLAVIYGSGH